MNQVPPRGADAPRQGRPRARGLFERFPHGLLLVDAGRRVLSLNQQARELLALDEPGPAGRTCCELVCQEIQGQVEIEGASCVTEWVLASGEALPDVQVAVRGGGAPVSVSAARVDAEDVTVLFQVRPGMDRKGGARAIGRSREASEASRLRIHMLGPTRIELAGERLGGEWVEQRPGLLLKYLVCRRHGVAASDQIAEALWPAAAPREALASLRHYVHVLRQKLEPGRPRRTASSFIKTQRGGYRLDSERVWIDAEELEQHAHEGLRLVGEQQPGPARALLESAVNLYGGLFLPHEPEVEWVLEERERLHHVVARACGALVEVLLEAGHRDSASGYLRRLADMEPLDTDVQRRFIEVCLRQGRRSDAVRRYELLRTRTLRELGHEPDFTLADLTP
jgi:DNA-binding SARP family transcriptional activator